MKDDIKTKHLENIEVSYGEYDKLMKDGFDHISLFLDQELAQKFEEIHPSLQYPECFGSKEYGDEVIKAAKEGDLNTLKELFDSEKSLWEKAIGNSEKYNELEKFQFGKNGIVGQAYELFKEADKAVEQFVRDLESEQENTRNNIEIER